MTNEELFTDLKQFIEATVSQQLSYVATQEDLAKLATKDDLMAVEQRLTTRIDAIDEKIDLIQDAVGETVQEHDHRLRRLEKRAA